jgi:hypothetical protein
MKNLIILSYIQNFLQTTGFREEKLALSRIVIRYKILQACERVQLRVEAHKAAA